MNLECLIGRPVSSRIPACGNIVIHFKQLLGGVHLTEPEQMCKDLLYMCFQAAVIYMALTYALVRQTEEGRGGGV